ncbi:helix-turn-helix transcriptional regulator [Mucilaginibacter sp.]|uniref:helix-turn-helix transcriptional regulator n=1 Tax=Mucilaginibacter sp. TaxID=1882438 RepID=UPI003D1359DB
MEKTSTEWFATSDQELLNQIGHFLQDTRLQQNKTQKQVAKAAGINRSTVGQLENGHGGTLLSLLQLLRVLEQLPVLRAFEVQQQVSPLQLAKLEKQKRQRARNKDRDSDITTINW